MRRARIVVIIAGPEGLMLEHSLDYPRVRGAKECHSGLSRSAKSMRTETLPKDSFSGLSDRCADARIGKGIPHPRDPKRPCRLIVRGHSSLLDLPRLARLLRNEDRAEDCQVPVHQWCEILRHLALIGPPALCVSRFKNDPPSLIHLTEALTQCKLSEVLMPDRMDSQECNHQAISGQNGSVYWTRKTLRPARVIFRPKPLRSSSHKISARPIVAGRVAMRRLVSLQVGMNGGLGRGYLGGK